MKVKEMSQLRLRPNVTFTEENGYDYGGLSRYHEIYLTLAKLLYTLVLLGNGSTYCPKRCSILTMACLSMQLGEGTNTPLFPGDQRVGISCSDDYTLQISPNSGLYNPGHLEYFRFFGRVCGLAIYNSMIIDGQFKGGPLTSCTSSCF